MASLFNSLMEAGAAAKAAIDRYRAPRDPNCVGVINPNQLAAIPIMDREECAVLYGPKPAPMRSKDDKNDIYDIVVHTEKHKSQSLSIFRSGSEQEARRRFGLYKAALPTILGIDEALASCSSLQTLCDTLRSYEDDGNYTLMHLAVQLDLRNVVVDPILAPLLDVVTNSGITPLMLAVKTENIWMLRYLLAKKAALEISDSGGNTVFHYAAKTNKEICECLCQTFEQEPAKPDRVAFKAKGRSKSKDRGDDEVMEIDIPRAPELQILNKRNKEGDTALHIACKEDKPECVSIFLCSGADINVTGTVSDEAPIHTALKSSSARCVKEIIQMYPKQLHTQDIKHGGTPLHWAKSKEIIEALAGEAGCVVDARNFAGDTALHVMAKHDRLDCALALITHGADINCRDNAGNTPLHLAVEFAHVSLVRALLVFDADTSLVNNQAQTPYKLALKMMQESGLIDAIGLGVTLKEYRKLVVFSLYMIGAHGTDETEPLDSKGQPVDFSGLEKPAEQKRLRTLFDDILANKVKKRRANGRGKGKKKFRGRVLSLDGGGIKGLVLTRMLLSFERLFGSPIIHNFDWLVGTSTGGILALALATGKTAIECQYLYFRLKDKVFVDSKPYDTKPFEDLLVAEFGNTKLSDIKHPKVCVTATLADRSPPDLHLFRNYPSPQAIIGASDYWHPELSKKGNSSATSRATSPTSPSAAGDGDTLVWKAARASGAAPSYFRPDGAYVDGGIIANNPSLDILTEIAEFNMAIDGSDESFELEVLLSLGTGVPPVKKTTVVDIFRPENAADTVKLFLNWDGMGKLMLDSLVDADNRVVDRCRAWCRSMGSAYFRFSPHMAVDVELDEKDDKILVDLMWSTMAYVHQRRDDVNILKEILQA